jgi:hypothetical protein
VGENVCIVVGAKAGIRVGLPVGDVVGTAV